MLAAPGRLADCRARQPTAWNANCAESCAFLILALSCLHAIWGKKGIMGLWPAGWLWRTSTRPAFSQAIGHWCCQPLKTAMERTFILWLPVILFRQDERKKPRICSRHGATLLARLALSFRESWKQAKIVQHRQRQLLLARNLLEQPDGSHFQPLCPRLFAGGIGLSCAHSRWLRRLAFLAQGRRYWRKTLHSARQDLLSAKVCPRLCGGGHRFLVWAWLSRQEYSQWRALQPE